MWDAILKDARNDSPDADLCTPSTILACSPACGPSLTSQYAPGSQFVPGSHLRIFSGSRQHIRHQVRKAEYISPNQGAEGENPESDLFFEQVNSSMSTLLSRPSP
jgi:hypothetical protein